MVLTHSGDLPATHLCSSESLCSLLRFSLSMGHVCLCMAPKLSQTNDTALLAHLIPKWNDSIEPVLSSKLSALLALIARNHG